MKDKELIAKVEETLEILEETESSLEQFKNNTNYKEVETAGIYIQRAKKVLNLLYERSIKNNKA